MDNFWENKSGIYYEGTQKLLNEIRKQKELDAALEQAKKPLSVKPSNVSEAINTLSPKAAYPSTHSSLIELCASDEKKVAPMPDTGPSVGVPFYDVHARMERHREWLLAEAVKAESAFEVARMKVRDEHEARKQDIGRISEAPDCLNLQQTTQAERQETGQLDYRQLATPSKLVEAFGPLTGMARGWFSGIGKPTAQGKKHQLLEARKVNGRPGKNSLEPMFDIIEVAQWLADGKLRFKSFKKQTSAKVVWGIVERNFPAAYAKVSSLVEQ